MFKKFNAVMCFCFVFLIVLSANSAFASNVRVDSIGSGALVPDEETDLNYNPAFVTYIDGQRLYGGMDFSYEKENYTVKGGDEYDAGKYIETTSNYMISPYIEYVNGMSDIFKIAIKYNPSFEKELYKEEDDPDLSSTDDKDILTEENKDKSPIDGRILIGFSLPADIRLGYSFSYYQSEFEESYKHVYEYMDSTFIDKSESEGTYYSQTLGLIFNTGEGNKYAVSLGQRGMKITSKNNWNDYNDDYDAEEKESPLGINAGFIPEIKLSEALTLRGNLFVEYMRDEPEYSYDAVYGGPEKFDAKDTVILADLGIGLNYRMDPGTLFTFTVNSNYFTDDTNYKEGFPAGSDYYTEENLKYTYQEIYAGIGLEKEILPNLLLIRCQIIPFLFRNMKQTQETEDQDGEKQFDYEFKITDIMGPIYSYSLGIGYQPSDNVMIDLNFSQILSGYSKREGQLKQYSYTGDVDYKNKMDANLQSYNLNFAATVKF